MADPAYLMIWVQILLLSGCSHVMAGYYLVIDEQFDSLDMKRWDFEVTANGGGNGAFEMYTPEPNNTFVKDGKLFIKPTLTADMFGEAWLTNGTLDMRDLYGRCTQAWDYGCLREGKYGTLNPVMSGCIRSRASIQYGKVEVMAKLPRGDWMWPTIWMLPVLEEYGDWPASGDVDIAEARGNRDLGSIGINSVMSSLHWGPNEPQDQVNMTRGYYTSPSGTWADGMHNYTLEWFSTGISVYVDDYLVLNAPTPPDGYWTKGGFRGRSIWSFGHQDAPFDKPFYLILNVAVGGVNGFFPDDVQNGGYKKPWKNTNDNASPDARKDFWAAKHLWYPTWQGDDAAMQVDSVRMWQFTNADSMGETTTTKARTSTTITTTTTPPPTTTPTTTPTPTPTPTPTTTEVYTTTSTDDPREDDKIWPIVVGCLVGLVATMLVLLIIFILLWRRQTLWMMRMKHNLQLSERNDGRRFDAFISYCGRNDDLSQSDDERFVIYKLRVKLEREFGYSLCIHQRDFIPGEAIADNILSAVDNSRRTILILSQRYIRSEWCKAEYKAAYTELLKRQHRIIPIMLEKPGDIPIDDPLLEHILKNITYIRYPMEESEKKLEHFWKKVQYSMPKVDARRRTALTVQLSVISVDGGEQVPNEVT